MKHIRPGQESLLPTFCGQQALLAAERIVLGDHLGNAHYGGGHNQMHDAAGNTLIESRYHLSSEDATSDARHRTEVHAGRLEIGNVDEQHTDQNGDDGTEHVGVFSLSDRPFELHTKYWPQTVKTIPMTGGGHQVSARDLDGDDAIALQSTRCHQSGPMMDTSVMAGHMY